jgi:Family of unknown function (DUF6282)
VNSIYDELVHEAVDLHCHIDVEFSNTLFRKATPEWEWLPRAEAAGMRGVVLKSHLWPTTSAIPFLEQLYHGSVTVLGSVTLNPVSGGLDPWAVEAAVAMGARAVFMPTWGSRNDHERHGFGRRLESAFTHFDGSRLATISTVDSDGKLTDEAHEILRLAHEYGVMLSTGHVSWQESLVIAREAKTIGFERLVFGHPLSGSVGAPADAAREAAALGAFLEFCWPTIAPGRHDPAEVVKLIGEVGPSRVVLTSDYFGGSNPSPSDLLRMHLGALFDAGLDAESIHQAAAKNPGDLIGIGT